MKVMPFCWEEVVGLTVRNSLCIIVIFIALYSDEDLGPVSIDIWHVITAIAPYSMTVE